MVSITKALLWDFDGTLAFRRGGMWAQTLVEAVREQQQGYEITTDAVRPYLSTGFPWHEPHRPHTELNDSRKWWDFMIKLLANALISAGVPAEIANPSAARAPEIYMDPTRWALFDDSMEALSHLGEIGWSHLIVSNHIPELRQIVDSLGISHFFKAIISSAEIGYEKPHPAIFSAALEQAGLPKKVWMIGDSIEADVLGPQALGIPGILVRKTDPRALAAVASLLDIEPIVARE